MNFFRDSEKILIFSDFEKNQDFLRKKLVIKKKCVFFLISIEKIFFGDISVIHFFEYSFMTKSKFFGFRVFDLSKISASIFQMSKKKKKRFQKTNKIPNHFSRS